MQELLVQGGRPLNGTVKIGGSKNAVLPILAATLLADSICTLDNVPNISDVHSFLQILEGLGAKTSFEGGRVTVDPTYIQVGTVEPHLVKHMRASILLLGPLLGRFKEVILAYPGGCVLGKRSVHAHLHALTAFGAEVVESSKAIHLRADELAATSIIMAEASVTATENAIMTAVCIPGRTEIRWAAMEPHVQDLCEFLVKMGADIQGLGTHTLIIEGGKPLHGAQHTVIPDYLEAGTFILAGVLTRGELTVENCPVAHLDSFFQKLEEVGARFTCTQNTVHITPHDGLHALAKLQTSVYPGFATDLQAPFAVLLTQCQGESRIHETLFEGRLGYLAELEKMGAKTEISNPHQAIVRGATPLRGAHIFSSDIRAGAAMVLAALVANGETRISDINYIDRGYEELDAKLRSLGASIERIQAM